MKLVSLLLITVAVAAAAEPGPRWDDSALENAGEPPLGYEMTPAFGEGFRLENALLTIPYRGPDGQPWHLVLCRSGEIWSFPDSIGAGEKAHLTFQLRDFLRANPLGFAPENGGPVATLLGGVLDREWPERPFLYLGCHQKLSPEPRCFILRFEVKGGSPLRVAGDPEVIFSWESNGHNGCDLRWGPSDGYLYASAGDGSSPGDPDNVGQQVDQVRGSILRLDVHGEPDPGRNYAVPADNPFAGMKDVRPELWCYGLRNPWRMAFHP